MEHAQGHNYVLGAKLVRGAYMVQERARAAALGYPSPIHNSVEGTHSNYHACSLLLLDALQQPAPCVRAVFATHNEHSVRVVVDEMAKRNIDPKREYHSVLSTFIWPRVVKHEHARLHAHTYTCTHMDTLTHTHTHTRTHAHTLTWTHSQPATRTHAHKFLSGVDGNLLVHVPR